MFQQINFSADQTKREALVFCGDFWMIVAFAA
jgi:hypothetical protein